jgi:hypothetical protein
MESELVNIYPSLILKFIYAVSEQLENWKDFQFDELKQSYYTIYNNHYQTVNLLYSGNIDKPSINDYLIRLIESMRVFDADDRRNLNNIKDEFTYYKINFFYFFTNEAVREFFNSFDDSCYSLSRNLILTRLILYFYDITEITAFALMAGILNVIPAEGMSGRVLRRIPQFEKLLKYLFEHEHFVLVYNFINNIRDVSAVESTKQEIKRFIDNLKSKTFIVIVYNFCNYSLMKMKLINLTA